MSASRSSTLLAGGLVVYFVLAPTALLGFLLLAVLTGGSNQCPADGGQQQLGGRSVTADQASNARTIAQTTAARGLPRQAAVVAVAVAEVESHLTNIAGGDRDSLGLFQQRPSQGWGSPAEITNPTTATSAFLDRLTTQPNWLARASADARTFGALAQAVQRSGFPGRYGPVQPTAEDLVAHSGVVFPPAAATAGPAPIQAAAAAPAPACPDTGRAGLPGAPVGAAPQTVPASYVPPADPRQRAVTDAALAQLGKPYVFGAKGPAAFDCSGLAQAAWSAAGVPIPAGTSAQTSTGTPVAGLDQLQPGDLLFIPGAGGSASAPRHVGLYLGNGRLIDAYDEHTGVVTDQLAHWSGQIVTIRRPGGTGPAALS